MLFVAYRVVMKVLRNRVFLLMAALLPVVSACAHMRTTNLSPAMLELEPSVQLYEDPAFDATGYQTFSVFSSSLISEKIQLGGVILEKQMLFALRNVFEELGYKFVELDLSPDFLVTLDASAPYKEIYITSQIISIPYWFPSHQLSIHGTTSGLFNYKTLGGYSSYGWGAYGGDPETTTIYMPRFPARYYYQRPGYAVGAYYPSVSVSVFDRESERNVWAGTGMAAAYNPDVRVSGQHVLRSIVREFPVSKFMVKNFPRDSGQPGIEFSIYTIDGNNYFPVITEIVSDLPAARAGLEILDMILAVDGVSTRNKTLAEIFKLVDGDVGTEILMTLWRVDEQIEVSVVRVQSH